MLWPNWFGILKDIDLIWGCDQWVFLVIRGWYTKCDFRICWNNILGCGFLESEDLDGHDLLRLIPVRCFYCPAWQFNMKSVRYSTCAVNCIYQLLCQVQFHDVICRRDVLLAIYYVRICDTSPQVTNGRIDEFWLSELQWYSRFFIIFGEVKLFKVSY